MPPSGSPIKEEGKGDTAEGGDGGERRKEIWSEVSVRHNGAEDPKTAGTFEEVQVPLRTER